MKLIFTLTFTILTLSVVAQRNKSGNERYIKAYVHNWEGVEEINLNINIPKKDSIVFCDNTSEFNYPKLLEEMQNKEFINDSLRTIYLNDLKKHDNEGNKRQLSFTKNSNQVNLTLIFTVSSGNNLKETLNEVISLHGYLLVGNDNKNVIVKNKIDTETLLIGERSFSDPTNEDLFVASSFLYYKVQKISNSWTVVYTLNSHYSSRQNKVIEDKKLKFNFLKQVSGYTKFGTTYNGKNK